MDDTQPLSVLLTTVDNPYNPHSQWDEWHRWDMDKGYNTNELLDRHTGNLNELLDDIEREQVVAMAMNFIIDEGPIQDLWTPIKPNQKPPIRHPTGG